MIHRLRLAVSFAVGVTACLPAAPALAQSQPVPAETRRIVPAALPPAQVKDLQGKLDHQGFSPGHIDGVWGPDTSAALRRFQQKNSLQATGLPDQATVTLLDSGPIPAPAPTAAAAPAVPPPASTTTVPIPAVPPLSGSAAATVPPPAPAVDAPGTPTASTAPQPASGANSFTAGEARRRIGAQGFQDVATLHKDKAGVWRGSASKDGKPVQVWLDYKGNVGQL